MHRSMAGASTAKAADALGALYWNPAVISGLGFSEVVIGAELLIPDTNAASTIPAGALGPFGPPTTLSGSTHSDSGVVPMTGIGVVYRPEDSPLTYGLGVITLAAGGVNFPGDPNNPLFAPTGPFNGPGPANPSVVLGPQAASATILSILPSASYQMTERLAVGFSPMIDVAVASFDPALFAGLENSNGDNLFTFPSATHSHAFWGGGFRLGTTYLVTDTVAAGFSYTSPQWFETWNFNSKNEVGEPLEVRTPFMLPMIYSMGIGYGGLEGLLLNVDVRFFDYENTQLLGQSIREGGAGWNNVWAVATGARYQVNQAASVQLGYLYNQNPVPNRLAVFNTQLPAITQHTLSAGVSLQMNESILLSLAYVHGFKNSVTGSVFPLRGTSVTLDTEYNSVVFGLHIRFGGRTGAGGNLAAAGPAPGAPAAQ
ncbi:MAG: OmpP1/FadL family transporter [Planctomycetaceae bacterium]